jgi:hypothetical protein
VADDDASLIDAGTEPVARPQAITGPEPDAGAGPGAEEPEFALGGELGGLAVMPAFQFGGRVERTGIALVHEGEYVVPAPGSGAVISPAGGPAGGPAGAPIVWSFPVEVEVVGELSEEHLRTVATHVFDELDTALRHIG